ncbi:TVC2 protein, partial [Piaya cayana]|nr:TVC2 protein [Piaya cayana]
HLFCFFIFFLDGQVLLKQRQPSITRRQTYTARIECIVEGILDFGSANIHWYRHTPSKGPERILYIGSDQTFYEESSYKNKYVSSKTDTNSCTFSVFNVNSNDEGTYYCAYW